MLQKVKFILGVHKQKMFYRKVDRMLEAAGMADTRLAEASFDRLQASYPPRPEYGYERADLYARASERLSRLLRFPVIGSPGKRGLELGAGDGVLSILLECYGHMMTLSDIDDWRVPSAARLDFLKGDCGRGLALPDASFDFAISYNAFEHFASPDRSFREMLRVLRPGGVIFLEFNPLYCSPWGLHAYRMLRMPYPQFLFSDEFIRARLLETGVRDLGGERNELQPLNRWKASQFESMWSGESVDVISCSWHYDRSHLNIVVEFPDSFRDRGISVRDLIISGVSVILRKSPT